MPSYDPLDLAQWSFWVLPRQDRRGDGQRSLALSRVEALADALCHHVQPGWRGAVRSRRFPGYGDVM